MLEGYVWYDFNQDGQREAGEIALNSLMESICSAWVPSIRSSHLIFQQRISQSLHQGLAEDLAIRRHDLLADTLGCKISFGVL